MHNWQFRFSFASLAILFFGSFVVQAEFLAVERPTARIDSNLFRLPNDTRPISYDIFLETRFDQGDPKFNGRVKIVVQVINETSDIVLNACGLEVKSIDLAGISYVLEEYNVTHIYDQATESLTITSSDKVLTPRYYYLTIEYTGTLRKDGEGFFDTTFTDEDGNKIDYASTLFKLTTARFAFPCYDEPAKKAVFKITIKHGHDYRALSNMPIIDGPIDNNDGTATTVFQQTTLMSTYLIAFAICQFDFSEQYGRIPHRIYSRNGTEFEREYALEMSVKTLEAIEDYLGIKYDLPKVDHLALPNNAAFGTENYGLIIYQEDVLLCNKEEATTDFENNVFQFITHEFGHQWFGNLVSPKWYTYMWLNEGFANIFTYIAAEKAFPEWDHWQRFHVAEFQQALALDGKGMSAAMTNYIESLNEISFVIYSKASSVINMFRHVLTEEAFQTGLNYYLSEMENAAADEDDLFRNFQKAVDEFKPFGNTSIDVTPLFKSWTNQPGYPLLTITRDYKKGSLVIKQSPFTETSSPSNSDTRSWWIPFNLATRQNPKFEDTHASGWLEPGESSKEIFSSAKESWGEDDWIVLNKKSTNYYRVNYDLNNWKLLTAALIKNPLQINVYNRAQLLNDAFTFVSSNDMSFGTFMDLTVYLKKEYEYAPWATANSFLTKLNQYLMADSDYGLFQYFLGKIIGNFYKEVGTVELDDDARLTKLSRSYAVDWACRASITDCLEATNNRLRAFVQAGKTVEPNLRASIFCNGLRTADEYEFQFLFKQLMDSKDQAYRNLFLNNVLGCAQNATLLEQYLQTSIQYADSIGYENQERIYVFLGVANKGPLQLDVAMDFLIANHEEFSKLEMQYGVIPPILSATTSIANNVVTQGQNKKFEQLLTTLGNYAEIKGVSDNLRATVKSNLEWMVKYRSELTEWLKMFQEKEDEKDGEDGNGAAAFFMSSIVLLAATCASLLFSI